MPRASNLEAAGETAIIAYITLWRIPNEADGYAGAGSGISGDTCRRLRQQRDHPLAIAHACSNSIANLNHFTDTCTYSNPNPICDSYSENYPHPDPFPCHPGLASPI